MGSTLYPSERFGKLEASNCLNSHPRRVTKASIQEESRMNHDIVVAQVQAALVMLRNAIEACPERFWNRLTVRRTLVWSLAWKKESPGLLIEFV